MSHDLPLLAFQLDEAAVSARPVRQLTEAAPGLTLVDAYEIQRLSIQRRVDRGEHVAGLKMGFTSRAKMLQMGVDDLILGRLTDAMAIPDGGQLKFARFVHPRVEPEIAFFLKKPLVGRITALEASNAIESVAPALEIIDSRYLNFKFSIVDVVADNSSSSAFVVGPSLPAGTDISNLGMLLELDGRVVQTGSSAAVLGHPLRAVMEAARLATQHGVGLRAGDIVFAGAATAAEPLRPGVWASATIQRLGRVGFSVQ